MNLSGLMMVKLVYILNTKNTILLGDGGKNVKIEVNLVMIWFWKAGY